MTMQQSLDYIQENYNNTFFLDSGTLLGIHRDNQILKGDNDIDLGIIGDKTFLLDSFLIDFKTKPFKISKIYFNGILIKIKLRKNKYSIDVNIYYNLGSFLGFPVRSSPINNYFKRLIYFKSKSIEITNFTNQFKMFGEPFDILNYYLKDPYNTSKIEKYLAFRYGDWSKPSPNWNYLNDDGGFNNDLKLIDF